MYLQRTDGSKNWSVLDVVLSKWILKDKPLIKKLFENSRTMSTESTEHFESDKDLISELKTRLSFEISREIKSVSVGNEALFCRWRWKQSWLHSKQCSEYYILEDIVPWSYYKQIDSPKCHKLANLWESTWQEVLKSRDDISSYSDDDDFTDAIRKK